jgi:hypothetical protein
MSWGGTEERLCLSLNWVDEHLKRFEQVRRTWPSEVVETGPMTYAWSPDRRA